MMQATRSVLFLALLALLCATPRAQTVDDPTLEVTLVSSDLTLPTTMAFIGPDDILVLEKSSGRVRRILNGTMLEQPVLDVGVQFISERGLLGIAPHPDFQNNRSLFLFYTESVSGEDDAGEPAGNRVYRYFWNGTALVSPLRILDLPVLPGPNHDGGIIAFGPDDRLYAVIGDLNRDGQLENFPDGAAPDDTAVIFRVDDHGNALPDNPFYDPADPANPLGRYFAYGVRNSFGIGFDPVSGDLWDTENGPSAYDELNRFDPGANSGWQPIMGPDARNAAGVDDLFHVPGSSYVDPQFSWLSPVAPTAIAFAHSRVMGCDNEHVMFVGDNNCGQIYRFELQGDRKNLALTAAELRDRVADNFGDRCNGEMSSILWGSGFTRLTDIKNGPDGALYVVTLFPAGVWRIGPKGGTFPDVDGDGVNDSCDCDSADRSAFAAPTEVPRLRLDVGPPTSLGWDSQTASAGPGTSYVVASGDLADLHADGGFEAACALAGDLDQARLVDPRQPLPGQGRYYMVRAGNACDPGTYGAGTPRALLDAAALAACPADTRH